MKTIRRLPIVFLLALLSVSLALPACSQLPGIIADVDEGSLVVQTIQTFINSYFVAHPNPTTQASVNAAIVKVETAASAVLAAARGAGDLSSGDTPAAVAAFTTAYTDLLALVKTFGVSAGTKGARMAAKPGGGLTVPAPEDLLISLRKKS